MGSPQHRHTFVSLHRSLILIALTTFCWTPSAEAAKNVILMIVDGGGHNQWLAASMYQGKVGKQVYDRPDWRRLSCCTYPLNLSHKPTGDLKQNSLLVYAPARAWPSDEVGFPQNVARLFLITTATDSAAAATALATGRKTYNNAINWSNDDRPMREQTIAEIAKSQGKSVGMVSSVPWSHATPAGLGGAHNVSRNHYTEIANEMIGAAWLDVIMGAGNPDFDDDGRPIADAKKRDFQYVGGQKTWKALKAAERPWKLIETKADFEALASGPTPPKLLGTAQVASTLQEKRGCGRVTLPYDKMTHGTSPQQPARRPFTVPSNQNVPSLAAMAAAAINCLDDNPKGFFLMIEGGAVDWANHANEPDRMIEEQIDYIKAVETVVAWIESHGGWDDTLLILTADHESGFLWGADGLFKPLNDCGPGKLPGMKFNSTGHSNSLVPLYARGPGSDRFMALSKGIDSRAAAQWGYSGQYIENTDVFSVMRVEVTGKQN